MRNPPLIGEKLIILALASLAFTIFCMGSVGEVSAAPGIGWNIETMTIGVGGVPQEDYIIYSDAGFASGALDCTWTDGGTFNWEHPDPTAPEGSKCCRMTCTETYFGGGILYRTEGWVLIPHDLSAYAGGDLKFWVKTTANLEVAIEGPSGTKSAEYISAYGWDGTNTWQEITIPLDDFTGVNLSTIIYPFMTTIQTSGTFYIDDVRWVTASGSDFTISVSPTSDLIQQDSSGTATVSITSVGGYAETVTLSHSGQPAGVTVDFDPSSGTPTFSSAMTVSVGAGVLDGIYPITITGTGADAKVHSCTYSLTVATSVPVRVLGRQILVNGSPFSIKGVGYAPTPIGRDVPYDFCNNPGIYQRDFPLLRAMGCNTIRAWTEVTSTAFLDAAYNEGSNPIYVVMGFWINADLDLSSSTVRSNYINGFETYVETYKDHPAVLMWCVGNEINYHYQGNAEKLRDWYILLDDLAEAAHEVEGSTYHPVTTANGELLQIGESSVSADDASMNYLDVWGANAYFGYSFGNLFSEYESKSSKPFFITEYGIDAWDHVHGTEYEDTQAEYAGALWDEMANSDIVSGGTIMAYSDEWWKPYGGNLYTHDYDGWPMPYHPDGYSNEEWWGVMRISDNGFGPDIMEPRQVYYTLQDKWGGPSSDFTISVSPTSGDIPQGGSDTATVTVESVEGYNETVDLSYSGQPEGVTVGFDPPSGAPSSGTPFTSIMTVSVGAGVPADNYPITITGTGADAKEHYTYYTLTVIEPLQDIVVYNDGVVVGIIGEELKEWSRGDPAKFYPEYSDSDSPGDPKCGRLEVNGAGDDWNTIAWFYGSSPNYDPQDLSAYAGGDLKFHVKTPVNLKVEIAPYSEGQLALFINDYGWDGNNTWQQITIPLDDYVAKGVESQDYTLELSAISHLFVLTIEQDDICHVDNVWWTAA